MGCIGSSFTTVYLSSHTLAWIIYQLLILLYILIFLFWTRVITQIKRKIGAVILS